YGWVSPDLAAVLSWEFASRAGLGEVDVLDAVTSKRRHTLDSSGSYSNGYLAPRRLAAVTPGATLVALTAPSYQRGMADGGRLWDVRKGAEVPLTSARRGFGNDAPTALALTDDGTLLAVGWHDGVIERLDVTTGRALRRLENHKGAVNGLAFSPDGRTLASARAAGPVRLWEAAPGKERHRFMVHRGAVTCVAFGARGRVVITGGADTTVLLWQVWPEAGSRAKWSDKERDAIWADLASPLVKTAFGAAR